MQAGEKCREADPAPRPASTDPTLTPRAVQRHVAKGNFTKEQGSNILIQICQANRTAASTSIPCQTKLFLLEKQPPYHKDKITKGACATARAKPISIDDGFPSFQGGMCQSHVQRLQQSQTPLKLRHSKGACARATCRDSSKAKLR